MAIDYSKIDYSQYPTWEKVVAPGGQVYYRVPESGYLYDPFLSSVKSRPVIFPDPKLQVEEKQRIEEERQRAIKAQEAASSPMGQITPILGLAGGTVAARQIMNQFPSGAEAAAEEAARAGLSAAGSTATAGIPAVTTASEALTAGAAAAPAAPTIVSATQVPGAAGAAGAAPGAASSTLGTIGTYAPGIIGAGLLADTFYNKKHGWGGAAEAAAGGAGLGFTVGGPVGALIGGALGGTAGYFGNFGDVDAYKTEWKRRKKLFDDGKITAAQLGTEPKAGKSKEQLIAEAKATGGNVEFAQSRNESILRPQDIQGYASILEKSAETGISAATLAELALKANAVREHHGTIDVKWDGIDLTKPNAGAKTTTTTTRSKTKSPGIDMQGNRIATELARRMDARGR